MWVCISGKEFVRAEQWRNASAFYEARKRNSCMIRRVENAQKRRHCSKPTPFDLLDELAIALFAFGLCPLGLFFGRIGLADGRFRLLDRRL